MKISKSEAEAQLAQRGLGTRADALAARVAIDTARWGDDERDASIALHGRRSYGLLISSIAVADCCNIDEDLMRLAAAVMTAADRAELSEGG